MSRDRFSLRQPQPFTQPRCLPRLEPVVSVLAQPHLSLDGPLDQALLPVFQPAGGIGRVRFHDQRRFPLLPSVECVKGACDAWGGVPVLVRAGQGGDRSLACTAMSVSLRRGVHAIRAGDSLSGAKSWGIMRPQPNLTLLCSLQLGWRSDM